MDGIDSKRPGRAGNLSTHRTYRQPLCSQPQPISITRDFSASLQYSLQNLLPCSAAQSHGPCAHLPDCSSAISDLLVAKKSGIQLLGGSLPYAKPHQDQGQHCDALLLSLVV